MNGPSIFFYFVLPVLIASGGWVALVLHERALRKDDERHHPAE